VDASFLALLITISGSITSQRKKMPTPYWVKKPDDAEPPFPDTWRQIKERLNDRGWMRPPTKGKEND